MLPKGGTASFLYVQEDHDVMSVQIEPEVVVEDLVVGEPWLSDDVGQRPARSLGVRQSQ